MVKIIETNLSMSDMIIMDHQNRVVEANSWEDYCNAFENYTLTFTPPSIYSKLVLKNSHKKINKIIAELKQDKVSIPKNSKTYENTYYKNKSNWHLIGNRFSVSDKCVKCKKCINICPVNNITMVNNKIQFGDNCVSCLGCYHRCPEKAIKYKNRNKKSRYLNTYVTDK